MRPEWCLLFFLACAVSGEGNITLETSDIIVTTLKSKTENLNNNGTTETNVKHASSEASFTSTETTISTKQTNDKLQGNKTSEALKENPLPTKEPILVTTGKPETTTDVTSTTEEQMGFINVLDMESESDVSTTTSVSPTTSSIETTTMDEKTRKERLSDQIRAVIKHYKEYGTVTVPDSTIPDPMPIPDIKKNVGGSEMVFKNTTVYGLSNFTVEHINTDLDKMQIYVSIYIRRLVILGNYSAKMFFRKVAGPFNTTLLYVEASGAAALVRDKEGHLQASESEMDMTFIESRVHFGNMGLMGTFLQGVVGAVGPVLFDSIKPFVLVEINNKVRNDVNKKIKAIGSKFLESGSKHPLDVALEEGRNYVRENGYDPYNIENYIWKYMPKHTNDSLIKVNISSLTLRGLSNFRRVGEVALSMDSGTVQMGVHLATSKLRGRCTWSVGIGKFVKQGHTNFTVDYVQGRGLVNQSLDVSQHPVLEDLDVNVGKVRIQMKGTGSLDFLFETVINTLPDLIRHITVDAIELPLKYAMQHILSEIKVEDILEKQLPELDKIGL